MNLYPRLPFILRLATVVACVVLFVLLLERDHLVKTLERREATALKRAREESFLGVYFGDQRIGYVKNRLEPARPDGYLLHEDAFLRLNILGENHPLRMRIVAGIDNAYLLRHFDFTLDSPFSHMTAKGEVEGSTVRLALTTGKETTHDTIHLARPPYLATNIRAYLLAGKPRKGDKIRVPSFDPVTLSGSDTVLEYQGLDKVLVLGRIYNFHHFVENFAGLKVSSWLDDGGKVVKEESPSGFVFIAEPEFQATDLGTTPGRELLSAVSIPIKGTMPDPERATVTRYRLTLPEGGEFDLDGDRQSLTGNVLTVRREVLPPADAAPCPGPEADLVSTPYVQAKNPAISKLAAKLVADTPGALARVRLLCGWVYDHIEKRPVLGLPDALSTLESRRGDCNEHAALLAALARSVGIPCRIVAGVVQMGGAFYYHAWNEVCLNGKWLSLDATRNQIPADLSHLKFVQGETEAMVKISGLIGSLKIEVLGEGEKK